MIHVLVVDDHAVVRTGICRLLDAERDIEVIGQTGSGREAVRLCQELQPNVVVLDYNLPDIDGLEATQQIVELGIKTRVLILTMYGNEEYATRLIRAGAHGFVVKVAPAAELVQAVRKVAANGLYVTPDIMEKMVTRIGQPNEVVPENALSNRELQVLVRLARGMTTKEVADVLCLSISTIETYRSRVLEKLNIRNNADMTRFAIKRGLIDLE